MLVTCDLTIVVVLIVVIAILVIPIFVIVVVLAPAIFGQHHRLEELGPRA